MPTRKAGPAGQHAPGMSTTSPSALAAAQAAYLAGSGLAPLVSMRAFEAVTGPKMDHWLVKTVGLLALGFAVLLAREAGEPEPDALAGLAASLPFAAASGWYGATGRISRIYLVDAAIELAFAALWARAAADRRARV